MGNMICKYSILVYYRGIRGNSVAVVSVVSPRQDGIEWHAIKWYNVIVKNWVERPGSFCIYTLV